MTTPRIEEMVEELWNKMCEDTCIACNGTGIHYDKVACSLCEGHGFEAPEKYLTQALTQAHQAGIDEAVEIIKEELRNAPLEVQMTKGVIFGKVIKALQDTNSRDSMLSNKESKLIYKIRNKSMSNFDNDYDNHQLQKAREVQNTVLLAYQMSLEAGNVEDVLTDIKNRIKVYRSELDQDNK